MASPQFPVSILTLLFILTAWSWATSAQETANPAAQSIKVSSELVRLSASVLDKNGDFVTGLERKDFQVLDDGALQPVLFFAPVEAPAEVLVVVETSPAVYLFHEEHIAAAYALLEGLAPDDEVALATYSDAPRAMLNFTRDKTELLAALGRIQYGVGMGQLNFYDSISTTMDWLPAAASKRALVLLTTGLDSSPPAHWNALAEKLRAQDVVIYSVALGGSLRSPSPDKAKPKKSSNASTAPGDGSLPGGAGGMSFAKANEALKSLASVTGGRAYFPLTPQEFVPIYREIAATLRHQYVLGIAPAQDGQYHELKVKVLEANGQATTPGSVNTAEKVYARQGYLAPKP